VDQLLHEDLFELCASFPSLVPSPRQHVIAGRNSFQIEMGGGGISNAADNILGRCMLEMYNQ